MFQRKNLCRQPSRYTNLNIQILVDLDSSAENEDPLCKIRKLPHVANAIQETSFFWRLDSLHLLSASLPGRHHLAGQPHYGTVTVAIGTGRQREENCWLVGGMECGVVVQVLQCGDVVGLEEGCRGNSVVNYFLRQTRSAEREVRVSRWVIIQARLGSGKI